jgi:hypothetical protein
MTKKSLDQAMIKVLAIFKKSGLTLHDLGIKMGYDGDIARQSAFQFLKTADPRISMLRRFATAMEIDLAELVAAKPKK